MRKRHLFLGLALVAATVATAQQPRLLTLGECKALALENNFSMKEQRINLEASQQTKKEAFTKYFPNISAGAVTFKADDDLVKLGVPPIPPLGLTEPSEIGMLEDGNVLSVTAIQPVFAGGQIVNSNKLAKVAAEASRLQLEMAYDQVCLETENYYWKIVSLKEAVRTLDVLDTLLCSLHRDVSVAVDAGVTTRNDLLTVRLKQNELQSTRLQVENGLQLSKMALCQHIGMPLDSAQLIDVPSIDVFAEAPERYRVDHAEALSSLSTYQLLEKNVEVSRLKRKISLGSQLPTVGVGVSYAYEDLVQDKSRNHFVMMATVTVPLSDWWGGTHRVKRAKLEERKALFQQEDGAEKLQLKMQQSWDGLTEAYEQILLSDSAVEEADENLRMTTANYKAGISALSELLDAQRLYRQTRNRHTDACINYQLKLTQYLQDTGRKYEP